MIWNICGILWGLSFALCRDYGAKNIKKQTTARMLKDDEDIAIDESSPLGHVNLPLWDRNEYKLTQMNDIDDYDDPYWLLSEQNLVEFLKKKYDREYARFFVSFACKYVLERSRTDRGSPKKHQKQAIVAN